MKTFEIINKIKDINEFVERFKKILSIKEEIEFSKSSQLAGDTSILFNSKNKKWILVYSPNDHIFPLIHELGHLYLSNITNCIYFAKQPESNVNPEIFSYVNSIVDAIVNFKISHFEEVYHYFLDYISFLLFNTREGINITNLPFPLTFYLDYYLEINYCLTDKDIMRLKSKLQKFLIDFENNLVNNNILDRKKLSLIINTLRKFSDYLDSEKATTFVYCMTKILKNLGLWSNVFINQNIKKLFPLK